VNRGDGWIWLFSRKTLQAIPDAYAGVGRDSLEAHLPAFLTDTRLAGVRPYEWAILLLGPPLLYLVILSLNRIVRRWRPGMLSFPVRLILLAAAIQWILAVAGFPILVRQVWSGAAILCTAVAVAWLLILLNGRYERYLMRRWCSAGQTGAGSLARVARRAVDVLIVVVIALLTLLNFGINPTPALAGLGVGGIAVALAAQKTLENVIAGVSLIFDNAVRVGDTLNVNGIVGTVDYIGLRSTRIRTLDRTVVSVPNGQIASMTLEALSARRADPDPKNAPGN
jgi:MscS family membrane protein